jgi:hypothetical protein
MPRSGMVFAVEHVARKRRGRAEGTTWPSLLVVSGVRLLRRLPLLERVPWISLRTVSMRKQRQQIYKCETHVQCC